MNVVDKFLTDYTTPERRDLFMRTYELLTSLGHVDHELNIENLVSLHGSAETLSILMMIEGELINACHSLLLNYFIVCRHEMTLPPYLTLLEFLSYIENTIESQTIVYYYNEELSADDQFLSWVEVFREDMLVEIGSLILSVTPTLIENIIQMHELKVELEPVEQDVQFDTKIRYLKTLKQCTNHLLLPVALVQKRDITSLHSIEETANRFAKRIYYSDEVTPDATPYNLIGIAILTSSDINALKADVITLINLLYDDVKKTNLIMCKIDEILDPSGDLCKIMNTI